MSKSAPVPGVQTVPTVRHALAVLPVPAHVVVEVTRLRGQGVGTASPVEVDEATHAKALVVHHAVAVANANALVRDAERIHRVGKVGRQWVVNAVRVLVGTFKEVHPKRRRVLPVPGEKESDSSKASPL